MDHTHQNPQKIQTEQKVKKERLEKKVKKAHQLPLKQEVK